MLAHQYADYLNVIKLKKRYKCSSRSELGEAIIYLEKDGFIVEHPPNSLIFVLTDKGYEFVKENPDERFNKPYYDFFSKKMEYPEGSKKENTSEHYYGNSMKVTGNVTGNINQSFRDENSLIESTTLPTNAPTIKTENKIQKSFWQRILKVISDVFSSIIVKIISGMIIAALTYSIFS